MQYANLWSEVSVYRLRPSFNGDYGNTKDRMNVVVIDSSSVGIMNS
jgi:hypothetical protein